MRGPLRPPAVGASQRCSVFKAWSGGDRKKALGEASLVESLVLAHRNLDIPWPVAPLQSRLPFLQEARLSVRAVPFPLLREGRERERPSRRLRAGRRRRRRAGRGLRRGA